MPTHTLDWTKKDKIKCHSFEIEMEYITHLKDFYKRLHFWMEHEEFKDFNGLNFYETLYWQRDLPDGMQEHHIWWRAYKHPGMHGNEQKQFTWFFKINMRTNKTSRKEIMHKGRKWKMYQTNLVINFDSYLILNYSDTFKKTAFLRTLLSRWKNWSYKDRTVYFRDQLINKSMEFQNICKEFLEMQQDREQPASVFPAGGKT